MGWNYRIIQDCFKLGDILEKCPEKWRQESHTSFNIHEVYYDTQENCPGGVECKCPIKSISLEPVRPFGETIEELREDLNLILLAFDKPVLLYQDIEHLFEDKNDDNGIGDNPN